MLLCVLKEVLPLTTSERDEHISSVSFHCFLGAQHLELSYHLKALVLNLFRNTIQEHTILCSLNFYKSRISHHLVPLVGTCEKSAVYAIKEKNPARDGLYGLLPKLKSL